MRELLLQNGLHVETLHYSAVEVEDIQVGAWLLEDDICLVEQCLGMSDNSTDLDNHSLVFLEEVGAGKSLETGGLATISCCLWLLSRVHYHFVLILSHVSSLVLKE